MSCEKLVAFALTESNDESDVVPFETRATRLASAERRQAVDRDKPIADRLDLGAWR